jgi:cytochrome d ubiquinol oxidase subunit I
MALGLATVLAPLQILIGDMHGLNTFKHQPLKVAAMEGHWRPCGGHRQSFSPGRIRAVETNRYEVAIPHLGSLIRTHEWNGEVHGLKEWPPENRPNVADRCFWCISNPADGLPRARDAWDRVA